MKYHLTWNSMAQRVMDLQAAGDNSTFAPAVDPDAITPTPYGLVMGVLIFLMTWVFMAFKIKRYPIGRTLGTMAGATAIVAFNVLGGEEAFAAINIETLALLFGTMVITVLLEREGFFQMVVRMLVYKCKSPMALMMRICIVSGFLSALVTNDTACVFLTPIVAEICHKFELPYGPFLIALGGSANLGSTATPVGNPQNMIIALLSKLKYSDFVIYIGPATLVCMAINMLFLFVTYRRMLSGCKLDTDKLDLIASTEKKEDKPVEAGLGLGAITEPGIEMTTTTNGQANPFEASGQEPVRSGPTSDSLEIAIPDPSAAAATNGHGRKSGEPYMPRFMPECMRPFMTRIAGRELLFAFVLTLAGTVLAFIVGAPLGWASVAGCVVMLLIDAREPDKTLAGVDWGLLTFFTSLFIVVHGFRQTGIPYRVWSGSKNYIKVNTGSGLLLFAIVVVAGSNTVSNVPLVLLMAHSMYQLGEVKAAWLFLSFISTIAGNLTLVGSVALLIVCERAKHRYNLSFWEYFRFGFITTVILTIIGSTIMFGIYPFSS